jgi:hypothetical protein
LRFSPATWARRRLVSIGHVTSERIVADQLQRVSPGSPLVPTLRTSADAVEWRVDVCCGWVT